MEKDKYLRISYRCIDESTKRIACIPLGFAFRMIGSENYYDLTVLRNAHEVIRFGENSRIVKDVYGQHWYHRQTRIGAMEAFDTFEPLPEDVVSEEYETKRVSDMIIYPYIRVDYARKLIEIYENHRFLHNDDEYREEFYNLNKGFIEDAE